MTTNETGSLLAAHGYVAPYGLRYEFYKTKWHSTKPIRGRAIDTRPIGKRSRDNELICRNVNPADNTESYACRLYQTDCVEYMPNGDIVLRHDGCTSPLTAKFMHQNSPFSVRKQANRIWVRTGDELLFPLPENGRAVTFRLKQHPTAPERCVYVPIDLPPLFQKVVDRKKSKEARAPYKAFLDWAKMFLALSDGWLMHETRKSAVPFREVGYRQHSKLTGEVTLNDYPYFDYSRNYDLDWAQHEEMYLPLLCHVLSNRYDGYEHRIAEIAQADTWHGGINFYDMRFTYKKVQARMYAMVLANKDVHKLVPVELKGKVIGDLVDG